MNVVLVLTQYLVLRYQWILIITPCSDENISKKVRAALHSKPNLEIGLTAVENILHKNRTKNKIFVGISTLSCMFA